jgi:hypothetical protein
MSPPAPRGLRTLITVFGFCAILSGGAVLLRLLAASRQAWQLLPLDVALIGLDLVVFAVNGLGFVALRRAWARTTSGAQPPPLGR